MKNNENINKQYVSIDYIYAKFSDAIDIIPMIISSEDIATFYVDSTEYITIQDFKIIKNIVYQKRTNKEFIIQNTSKLVSYTPHCNDSLHIIYESNETFHTINDDCNSNNNR